MAWFLRAIEGGDGRWRCQWGTRTFDVHDHLQDALAHLGEVGATIAPATVFVHHSDGTIEELGSA